MTIEVNLTEKEFRRFCRFDTLILRKAWRPSAIFAGIMSVSAAICYYMNHVRGAVLLGNVLLIIGLGMPVVYFSTFFSSVKKQCKHHGLARPQLVYTLELTDKAKGIRIHNEKEQAEYEWKRVFHVFFRETAAYLYMTPQRAFILPYSCVDMEQLRALVEKKMPKERITVQ